VFLYNSDELLLFFAVPNASAAAPGMCPYVTHFDHIYVSMLKSD